jgi:hypothetical protein
MRGILGCLCTLTAVIALTAVQPAHADVIYNTIPSWNGTSIVGELTGASGQGVGCDPCSTIAETFVAPAGNLSLNSFTFLLGPGNPIFRMELTGFVFAFNGDVQPPNGALTSFGGAVGSPLYLSPTIDYACGSCNPGGVPAGQQLVIGSYPNFTPVTVNVENSGGLTLVAGQEYVLGLTTDNPSGGYLPNSINSYAALADVPILPNNGGGVGVFPNDGANFSELTSQPWWDVSNGTSVAGNQGIPTGGFAYSADFGQKPSSLTITGTISPGVEDLQYKDLVYYLWDGSSWYEGESALTGSCAAGATCNINDSVYYTEPPGYGTPLYVYYTILGFYGDAPPGNCNIYYACNVTYNPDIFMLTNGYYQQFLNISGPDVDGYDFGTAWGTLAGYTWGFQVEDAIASALWNGQSLTSQGLLPQGGNAFFFATTRPGVPSGGIYDFSDPVANGTYNLTATVVDPQTQTQAPEPGTVFLAGGVLVALGLARRKR